jgi:N-acetylmuramoyl-L-alanine amidase
MPASNFHARRLRLLAITGCLCLLGSLCAGAASRHESRIPLVTGIRYWSTPMYTRVAIDLEGEVHYKATRVSSPDRIFFDLEGTRLSSQVAGKIDRVTDEGYLRQIHAIQLPGNVTRVILNVSDISQYYAFFLPNPARLIIDIRGGGSGSSSVKVAHAAPAPVRTLRRSTVSSASIAGIGLGPSVVASDDMGEPLSRVNRKPARTTSPRPVIAEVGAPKPSPAITPPHVAPLPASGEHSLVRTLGLKINRIVIDAGHGGHDPGTLGPDGIEEKNVVLDVALRLGALLKQRLGADVIYTRDTDTFVPLETRTEIANKARADLFISIHVNSSSDPTVRGVETYYLNFTTSADALAVAARENAVSNQSIHQLSDLVKKIALQDKISESREFASDVEQSLYDGLEDGNSGLKDRGVKKAPFVVLIGANMPSILAEISFLTNPQDASELRRPQYRERIAESLYSGVARYVEGLDGVRVASSARASE